MRKVVICLLFLLAVSHSELAFERIGGGRYYIGNEKNVNHYFDWFLARRVCREHTSTLVSLETVEELEDLESYIAAKGFPNGSTFATSGNNFNGGDGYHWAGGWGENPLTFIRWLPGVEKPLDDSFLSLQLVNSSLYMVQSEGLDDYYICEYKPTLRQFYLKRQTLSLIILMVAICLMGFGLMWAVIGPIGTCLMWLTRRPEYIYNIKPKTDDKNKLLNSDYGPNQIQV